MTTTITIEPLDRLSRDLKAASATLSHEEARFLVDLYYTMQDDRKRAHNQVRAMSETEPLEEPHEIVAWVANGSQRLEDEIRKALDVYSSSQDLGAWAKSNFGIGPVIAAGLLAHIDISKAPTVGHIWRFAGLDPTLEWQKGQKRPYNAKLKTLCWKIGESFVKVSNNPNDVYGKVYAERKLQETAKNDAGDFADQAAEKLKRFKIGKDTDAHKAYSQGKLPPAHIHSRAKRYATKLFLSHYHHVGYELLYGTEPPKPYILNQPNHTHYLSPPNWPMS
mgnify:CR=1 FL=1